MPRYFFHTYTEHRLIQDTTGLELPSLLRPEDAELSLTLWSEVFDRQLRISSSFVITDEFGKVLFVAGE